LIDALLALSFAGAGGAGCRTLSQPVRLTDDAERQRVRRLRLPRARANESAEGATIEVVQRQVATSSQLAQRRRGFLAGKKCLLGADAWHLCCVQPPGRVMLGSRPAALHLTGRALTSGARSLLSPGRRAAAAAAAAARRKASTRLPFLLSIRAMATAAAAVPQGRRRTARVAVIGAGAAGLAAARELRAEGHSVVVLERGSDVGGVWAGQHITRNIANTWAPFPRFWQPLFSPPAGHLVTSTPSHPCSFDAHCATLGARCTRRARRATPWG